MSKAVKFRGGPKILGAQFQRSGALGNTTTTFVDLFSGCGGLSLGFTMAGLEGQFAVERDAMAFKTFSANLLGERTVPICKFAWPAWLEKKPWAIDALLSKHTPDLLKLRGQIDILAGGPPCQGFSFSGSRRESDPRNMLFKKYVKVVDSIRPAGVILENVPGMKVAHASRNSDALDARSRAPQSFYERLRKSLGKLGYDVQGKIIQASSFGVPQARSRLIVVGIREDLARHLDAGVMRFFELLEIKGLEQRIELGLLNSLSASDAISDLETDGKALQPSADLFSRRFVELSYGRPRTRFQKLMHAGCDSASMDSMRLARHRPEIQKRFARILAECPQGIHMNEANRSRFGLKKHRIHPMSPQLAAPTITTLPDDILHYMRSLGS